jgi:transposase
VPPRPIRELRDLNRYRASLEGEHTRVANRIQKVLEDANIKLASVASDVLGQSGRHMLCAIITGECDADRLAEMAQGRLRNRIPELRLALHGRVFDHHRFCCDSCSIISFFWKERFLKSHKRLSVGASLLRMRSAAGTLFLV